MTSCDTLLRLAEEEISRLRAMNDSLREALTSSCDEQRAQFRAEGNAPCEAAIEVQALRTENEKLRLDYELLSGDYCNLEEDNRRLRAKAAEDDELFAAMRQEIEELHGLRAENEALRKSLKRALEESEGWLEGDHGCRLEDVLDYDGWADEACRLLDRGDVQ